MQLRQWREFLRRRWWLIVTVLFLTGTALAIRAVLFVNLPDVDDLDAGLHVPSLHITDRHGRLLYEVIGEEDGRHSPVALDEVPQACIDATIATEDANFYTNPGIDARGVLRALWLNLRTRTFGPATSSG